MGANDDLDGFSNRGDTSTLPADLFGVIGHFTPNRQIFYTFLHTTLRLETL